MLHHQGARVEHVLEHVVANWDIDCPIIERRALVGLNLLILKLQAICATAAAKH